MRMLIHMALHTDHLAHLRGIERRKRYRLPDASCLFVDSVRACRVHTMQQHSSKQWLSAITAAVFPYISLYLPASPCTAAVVPGSVKSLSYDPPPKLVPKTMVHHLSPLLVCLMSALFASINYLSNVELMCGAGTAMQQQYSGIPTSMWGEQSTGQQHLLQKPASRSV